MNSKTLKLIFAAALGFFPTASLQAGVTSVMNLDLRCYIQEKTSIRGDIDAGKVKIIRMSSKQLLRLVGDQLGVRFGSGSQLKVTEEGKVIVEDVTGRIVNDVSQFFRASLDLKHGFITERATG